MTKNLQCHDGNLQMCDGVITVISNPNGIIGKRYSLKSERNVSKESSINSAFYIAEMKLVNSLAELKALIEEVSNSESSAILNCGFHGVDIGEEFIIGSQSYFDEEFNINSECREDYIGVKTVSISDKEIKAVTRLKENCYASKWQFFDRDIDEHTPSNLKEIATEEWIKNLSEIFPGLGNTAFLHIGSSSSRVMQEGTPMSVGNGHLWFEVSDASDIDRFRREAIVRAMQSEYSWKKPRLDRATRSKVVGESVATIFDPAVFVVGRIIACGMPIATEPLTVESASLTIINGGGSAFDTATVIGCSDAAFKSIKRKHGLAVSFHAQTNSLLQDDLTLDTEIELEHGRVIPLRELLQTMNGKIRCQTPFRASESFAAFIQINERGIPYLYDSGTMITHWVNVKERDEAVSIVFEKVVAEKLPSIQKDSSAAFDDEVLGALSHIKSAKPQSYERIRTLIKSANNSVHLTHLDRAVKSFSVSDDEDETHHGFATKLLDKLSTNDHQPVTLGDMLFVPDEGSGMWQKFDLKKLQRLVAETFDGQKRCSTTSDYRNIAQQVHTISEDQDFFFDVKSGIACGQYFYAVTESEIVREKLTCNHRQRFRLNIEPQDVDTPQFTQFLKDTFKSENEEEMNEQIALLQEISGSIIIGAAHRFQKAFMFYDVHGRAGKGTFEKILRSLIPSEAISNVSPMKMGDEYYVAQLLNMRYNVVGELPDDKPIPSAEFKAVLGEDLLTGRHPTLRPFTFKNEAGHLFMSNHLISTTDHSEAFYARWKLVNFPNSLLESGASINPYLSDQIIRDELPGILSWALEGAKRLIANGKYSSSRVHDDLMVKWRRRANSIEEFIFDECEISAGVKCRRSELYRAYVAWCSENGRRPVAKSKFADYLQQSSRRGIRHTNLNGYEIFIGIKISVRDDPPYTV